MHYMDANKTAGEEARRQLHKNAASVTVQKYLSQDGSLFYARVKSGQSSTWSFAK